jgi:hypothetical protein
MLEKMVTANWLISQATLIGWVLCQMYILSLKAERSDQAHIANIHWNIGGTEDEEQMSSVYTEQYNYEI